MAIGCLAVLVLVVVVLLVWRGRSVAAIAAATVSVGVVGFVLAVRALDGLHPPVIGTTRAAVRLLGDPSVTADGAVQAEARLHGKHVLLEARGSTATALVASSAGAVVVADLRVRAISRPSDWSRSHHLAGRASLVRVLAVHRGPLAYRAADAVRSLLLRSAAPMPPGLRSLFAGFVLGDDREQVPEVTADFRAAGLSHLLVVSGQNLAFLTGAAAPMLRRTGRRARLALGLVLVGAFALVTRFEPSVLRAASMAVVALVAAHLGRPQPVLRVLAIAVGVLLVVDPLLARSAGFALSVGACVGIALLDAPIRALLVGRLHVPMLLAVPLATTLAAQAGTAPVLLPIAGGIPVASLPANLLALPAAAPVMAWGVAAGLPAGLLGRRACVVVHLPTQLALRWVAGVARRTGSLPLGSVGAGLLVVLTLVALALHCARSPGVVRRGPLVLSALVLLPFVVGLRAPLRVAVPVARGASVWAPSSWSVGHRAEVLVVSAGADAARLLDGLRRARLTAVDLLVVRNGGRRQDRLVRAVGARVALGGVLAGHAIAVPGVPWTVAAPGMVVRAGGTRVAVGSVDEGRLVLTVTPTR